MGEWQEIPFEDAINFQEGPGILAKDFHETGIPLIRLSGLSNDNLLLTGCNYLDPDKVKLKWSHFKLELGDILLSTSASLGRIATVDESGIGAIAYTGIVRMRPQDKRVYAPFIRYLLQGRHFQHQVHIAGVGSVLKHFGPTHLRRMSLVLPPRHDQKVITHILGSLDEKIEANRRMNETLENTARAIFKSWFVDFDPVHAKANDEIPEGMSTETAELFPDDFQEGELGLIPRGWGVGILKDLCSKVENGGTPRRSEETYWKPETIKWLTSGEVRQKIIIDTANSISENGYKNSSAKLWHFGTTVVALYGATAGQVTLLATSTTANQACCGLTPLPHTRYFLQIHTSNSTKALESQASGSAQQNLSKGVVESFPTIIPSEEILNIFENKVSVMFEKMILNLEENKTLAELRDTLLPRLISGELRVEDVSEFVGDV